MKYETRYFHPFMLGGSELKTCSTHKSLEAARKAVAKCEKSGGMPHEIIMVSTIVPMRKF